MSGKAKKNSCHFKFNIIHCSIREISLLFIFLALSASDCHLFMVWSHFNINIETPKTRRNKKMLDKSKINSLFLPRHDVGDEACNKGYV